MNEHEEHVSVSPAVAVGAQRHTEKHVQSGLHALVGVHAIAGPETAAKLGIPVGTVFAVRGPEDIDNKEE